MRSVCLRADPDQLHAGQRQAPDAAKHDEGPVGRHPPRPARRAAGRPALRDHQAGHDGAEVSLDEARARRLPVGALVDAARAHAGPAPAAGAGLAGGRARRGRAGKQDRPALSSCWSSPRCPCPAGRQLPQPSPPGSAPRAPLIVHRAGAGCRPSAAHFRRPASTESRTRAGRYGRPPCLGDLLARSKRDGGTPSTASCARAQPHHGRARTQVGTLRRGFRRRHARRSAPSRSTAIRRETASSCTARRLGGGRSCYRSGSVGGLVTAGSVRSAGRRATAPAGLDAWIERVGGGPAYPTIARGRLTIMALPRAQQIPRGFRQRDVPSPLPFPSRAPPVPDGTHSSATRRQAPSAPQSIGGHCWYSRPRSSGASSFTLTSRPIGRHTASCRRGVAARRRQGAAQLDGGILALGRGTVDTAQAAPLERYLEMELQVQQQHNREHTHWIGAGAVRFGAHC
jgi:hypothetical protein